MDDRVTIIRKTLSIPKYMDDYLEENPDLSPSKMLQSKIMEIMENRRLRFAEIAKKDNQILFLNKKLAESGSKVDVLEKENTRLKRISRIEERTRASLARS